MASGCGPPPWQAAPARRVTGNDWRPAFPRGQDIRASCPAAQAHECCRRAQLQADLVRRQLGGLGVGVGGFLLIAVQFVAVSEVGQHVAVEHRRVSQGRNRGLVIVLFAVVVGDSAKHHGIVRVARSGLVQQLPCALRLLQLQVSDRHHQFRMRRRMNGFGTRQQPDSFLQARSCE